MMNILQGIMISLRNLKSGFREASLQVQFIHCLPCYSETSLFTTPQHRNYINEEYLSHMASLNIRKACVQHLENSVFIIVSQK
jgi:hypothetical protein